MPTVAFAPVSAHPQSIATPTARRVFFPNLNGLRFLAVLLVVIDHVEVMRFDFGLPSFWEWPGMAVLGQLGVTLFFVLSGFLITYLLLAEKETLGRIKFGDFYLRRVLRIWPLYYVVVVLGLFVLPHIDFFAYPGLTPLVAQHLGAKTALFAFIMPNAAKELYPAVPYLTQAWSIGVEEQFYIIWPVLVHFSHRYLRNFLLLAGAVYIIGQLSWALTTPHRHLLPINEATTFLKNFLYLFRIQSMAIGGVFALVLYRNWTAVLNILTGRAVQMGTWLLLLVLLARGQTFRYVTFELYSVLFGIVVLNLARTDTSVVNLRHPLLDYLGRISYGLYMLHGIAIVVALRVSNWWLNPASPAHHTLMYPLVFGLTIALAGASYRYIESPFLQVKKRFARIPSGS